MTFEYILHAAFVADTIWGDKLEPARTALDMKPSPMSTTSYLFQCFSRTGRCLGYSKYLIGIVLNDLFCFSFFPNLDFLLKIEKNSFFTR